ncbi:MAG: hypothetical protein GC172_07935 [Phycisphaera sp.]|nr:hypothetical protein [Phycisphaera sp.]
MEGKEPAQPNAAAPEWSITKAEWDGLGSRAQKLHIWLWVSVGGTVLFGVLLLCAPLFLTSVPEAPLLDTIKRVASIAGVVVMLLAIPEYFWMRRSSRTWDALHAEVWESRGCACPWCRERVDTAPCRGHGFTRAEQPLLLRYWESMATTDIGGLTKYGDQLLARQAAPTGLARARRAISKAAKRSLFSFGDPDATPLQRLRAALPSILVQYAIIALLGFAVWHFFGRSVLLPVLGGCWWIMLFIPISAISGPVWKVGKLRCAKCGQLCASAQPTLCAECGSDLTLPAAVSRIEQRGGSWKAAIFFVPFVLIFAGNPLLRSLVSVLPPSVQSPIYAWTRPPYDYFQSMTVATMTQAEIDGALEVLISCAAPDGPRPLLDFDFLPNAMAAGKVQPATIERAARTVVQADLAIARDGDAVVATVTPEFGTLIFGMERTPRLVFGGVSLDGETWTKGADWSIFAHDVEDFWRERAQGRALPESKLAFTARLEGVPPGTRTVRARCWIVVWGPSWQRYTPEFDESDALIPPADALGVYPLELEATVTTR